MIVLHRTYRFCASHRYWRDEWTEEQNRAAFGKCALPHGHGHNYRFTLRIAGEQPSFIPADRLVAAGTATYAIDRGVEPEGLVALTWIVDDRSEPETPTRVDSYLRCRYPGDSARLVTALNDIAAAPAEVQPAAENAESEASDD